MQLMFEIISYIQGPGPWSVTYPEVLEPIDCVRIAAWTPSRPRRRVAPLQHHQLAAHAHHLRGDGRPIAFSAAKQAIERLREISGVISVDWIHSLSKARKGVKSG